ncbi:MAG: HAD-IIIC family phosphatase [Lachnospiraceae bacterium]|jgi:FkbH-like protein|nr:HAD-IIIC family phosphatase [Lachnospiraceae bacterium]
MTDSKKKVALLSNVTVDLIVVKLRKRYELYLPAGFDTWVQEALNPASGLYGENVDAVVVLLDGTEARAWKSVDEGTERITLWKQALTSLVYNISAIPIFVSTVDIRENKIKALSERKFDTELQNYWYQFIQSKAEEKNNVYVLDLADTIAEIGRKQFYSNKMWYMSSMPYSRDGLNIVVEEISRVLSSAFESRKKIIALDLDNTLWGGVIGEDGIEGIELSDHKEGQRYYDFQRQLLEMKNRGIVLAVNSKNNPEDAEAAIQRHPAMLLRDNDFVSRKINWENKAVNLKSMESELNMTEGGFIFIDDNPVERETVKGECPEILVPDFPEDTTELLRFAEDIWFDYCRPLQILDEDIKKTQMYQTEARRKQEMSESLNLDDYIAKLEIVAVIHRMRPEEKERVVQLINKTNQFNVTTKRYTQMKIDEIEANSENAIYVVYSSDKYGDNGLISVIILKGSGIKVHIDTFLMSCRVMGRKLEDVIINELAAKCRCNLVGEFIPTAKNAPVKELYDRLGFAMVSDDDGHKVYELDATEYEKKEFNSYKEIRFEG